MAAVAENGARKHHFHSPSSHSLVDVVTMADHRNRQSELPLGFAWI